MSSEFPSTRQTARVTPGIMRRPYLPRWPTLPWENHRELTRRLTRARPLREDIYVGRRAMRTLFRRFLDSPDLASPEAALHTVSRTTGCSWRAGAGAHHGNGHIYVAPVKMELTFVATSLGLLPAR
jgi:hypothetical protein